MDGAWLELGRHGSGMAGIGRAWLEGWVWAGQGKTGRI